MILRAIGNPAGSLLTATGKTKIGFYWNLVIAVAIPVFVYLGSSKGVEGVAFSVLCSGVLLFYLAWFFVIKPNVGGNFKTFLLALYPDINIIKSFFKRISGFTSRK